MQAKSINLKESVYQLCNKHPELKEILQEIGFRDITKPGMLETAGRFMTLPKGAALKKIDIETIKLKLSEHGFEIE